MRGKERRKRKQRNLEMLVVQVKKVDKMGGWMLLLLLRRRREEKAEGREGER